MRYCEDFTVGDSFELGSYTVSEQGILDFAREFDPQPFHIDPEAARKSIYGGPIASGWHTTAIFMRLFVVASWATPPAWGPRASTSCAG